MWLPGVDVSQGLPHNVTVGPGDSCKYGTDKPKDKAGAGAGCMGVCIGVWVGSFAYRCRTDSGTPQGRGLAWLRSEHQRHLRWGSEVGSFSILTEAQNTSSGSDTVSKYWEQADPGSQLGSDC